MAPSPIRRIGRFEILSLLGSGGMGEVYRARDTRLGRDVAVKILPASIASDGDSVSRFEQEARAASALNHPNIVTIFDVGEDEGRSFIVTELLEGQTLRDRMSGGPLPLAEAADVASSAATGLAAAHATGIIHRDVKPENIFLAGKRRQVKLLDFGIARLTVNALSRTSHSGASTVASTASGVFIGTPGYIAPEQARGEQVDARADIFALGCVLYEMLTGVQPFGRKTTLDTLAAVIHEQPPTLAASEAIPAAVARVVQRALEKDPAERFQSIEDFAFALRNAVDIPASGTVARPPLRRLWPWLAGSAAAIGAIGAILFVANRAPAVDPFELRSSIVVPWTARPISPVISPDGKWVAYIGLAGPEPDVYVQALNGSPPVNLTRPHNLAVQRRTIVGRLDVAPDGSFITVPGPIVASGLFQPSGISSVPAPFGGPPRRVGADASVAISSDGKRFAHVLANPIEGDGIAVADADGSARRVLIPMVGGVHIHQLAWSPDDRYIYYVWTLTPNHPHGDIFRIPSAGGTPEIVVRTQGTAMYPSPTPDGRAIIYAGSHHGEAMNLWWHPLDGSPERRLTVGMGEYTEPYVSRSGTSLVCVARRRNAGLVRVAADATDGAVEPLAGATGDTQPATGGDGRRIYVSSSRTGDRRIWSTDAKGEAAVPLTTGGFGDERPTVSPDGRRVAFISSRDGRRGIWVVAAEGSTPRLVTYADVIDPVSWAPDSRRIVYVTGGGDRTELRIVDVETGRSEPVSDAAGRVPAWGPHGDTIVVVRATNNTATAHFISPQGAEVRPPIPITAVGSPVTITWSPDGRRLALINLPGRGLAEAWVLEIEPAKLRRAAALPAPHELDGAAWSADGRSLLLGRIEFETEVMLIEGLPRK